MATADEQLNAQLSGAAALAAKLDKEQLGNKVRVYSLAKQLGISSKVLLGQLHTIGLDKKAQSALNSEEVTKLFDSLQASTRESASDEETEKSAKTSKPAKKATKAAKKTSKSPRKRAVKATSAKKESKESASDAAPSANTETANTEPANTESANAEQSAEVETQAQAQQTEEAPTAKKTRKRAVKKSSRTKPKTNAQKADGPADEPVAQEVLKQDEPQAEVIDTTPEAESETESPARKRGRTRRVVKRSAPAKDADNKADSGQEPAAEGSAVGAQEQAPEAAVEDATASAPAEPASAEPASAEPASAESAGQDEESEAGEKLRYRVQKNVENEILQIEGKVETELAQAALEALSEHGHTTEDTADSDSEEHDIDIDDSFVESLLTPPAKPAPEDDVAAAYAPIFMPPRETTKPEASSTKSDADGDEQEGSSRRRRGSRGTSRGRGKETENTEKNSVDEHGVEIIEEPRGIKGSTRIESQRRRRAEMRSKDKENRHVVTQAEFLARREAVERTMVVRERERHDHHGSITQVGVLEDGMLVEHFVTDETNTSAIGNIYLGRVQNVLPSMEAAFIDIGTGRNGVLYAGEVNWRQAGLGGRSRKIEHALKSGDQVLVQVAKDPMGHKGPRLTTQISLPGRFLVYVPGGRNAGISRKLPAPERKRLREILERVVPDQGGAIIRTAAENVSEEAIAADVNRLHDRWNDIQASAEKEKKSKGTDPVALYEEPAMLVKVVRDLFNEDFDRLVVDGEYPYEVVSNYVNMVAPDLADRVKKYDRSQNGGVDAFETYRIDEQLQKALSRKVWLPSGGTLVIDRTEAMTVVDVNTGKFTGTGGNLEETVTKNNLEAAEEIVRQMRLRDLGGMIVVDFIDMVLPENQELVLRRLKEALGRDRTRHQVSEVTSLGLVQMTRKRLGSGLLETFSTECEVCQGRGLILHEDPVDESLHESHADDKHEHRHDKRRGKKHSHNDHRDDHREDRKGDNKNEHQDEQHDSFDEESKSSARHSKGRRNQRGNTDPKRSSQREHSPKNERRRDDSDLEKLIAGVVVESSGAEPEESVSDIESIAYAASERAEALDEVGEFSSYVSDADKSHDDSEPHDESRTNSGNESYEKALKEFEESPRRKRKTRGNSRSDHKPRPEDFGASAQKESDAADSTSQDKEQGLKQDSGLQVKRDPKRRRVRALKKKPAQQQTQVEAQPQPVAETADEQATKDADAKAKSEHRESQRAQVKAVTRGRRRAVRRVTQPQQASSKATAKEASASKASAPEATSNADTGTATRRVRTDNGVEVTTVRRGRKRAVRRIKQPTAGTNQTPKAQKAQPQQSVEEKTSVAKDGGNGRKNTAGRTRRRVARRTT